MADSDVQGEVSQGFGGYFTRSFSIVTLIAAYQIWNGAAGMNPEEATLMAGGLGLLGLHGVLTKLSTVGFVRKLLCYLSGVAGATVAWRIFEQLL